LQWIRDVLLYSFLEPKRVMIMATKLAMSISQQKKSGASISAALKTEMNYEPDSFKAKQVFTRQQVRQ
jgi:hypothetical protein